MEQYLNPSFEFIQQFLERSKKTHVPQCRALGKLLEKDTSRKSKGTIFALLLLLLLDQSLQADLQIQRNGKRRNTTDADRMLKSVSTNSGNLS